MESRAPIFPFEAFDLNCEPEVVLSPENILVPELAEQIEEAGKGRLKRPLSQAPVTPSLKKRCQKFMETSHNILEPILQQESFKAVPGAQEEAEIDEIPLLDLNNASKAMVEAKAPAPVASIFQLRDHIDLNCEPKIEFSFGPNCEPNIEFSFGPNCESKIEFSFCPNCEPKKDFSFDLKCEPKKDFSFDPNCEHKKEFSFDLKCEPKKDFSFDLNCEPKKEFSFDLKCEPKIDFTYKIFGRGMRPQSQSPVTPPLKKIRWQKFLESSNCILEPRTQQDSFGAAPARPKETEIDEIDLPDLNNVRSGVQYVKELYTFYDKQQHLCRPRDYMPFQCGINADTRASLVHWMMAMHSKLYLEPETLYLAVSIVDRFLSVHPVNCHQLSYVGISSLLIASKYEEDWAPLLNQFINVAGGDYTGAQVCFWEKMILNKLDWYLTVPTVYMFIIRYVKAAKADEELERHIYYYGELGLKQYNLILYCPSLVAAATVYAARYILQRLPLWTDTLQRHTSFCESQLLDCAEIILQAHLDALKD